MAINITDRISSLSPLVSTLKQNVRARGLCPTIWRTLAYTDSRAVSFFVSIVFVAPTYPTPPPTTLAVQLRQPEHSPHRHPITSCFSLASAGPTAFPGSQLSLQVQACIRVSSPPTRDPLHNNNNNNNSHQFRPFSSTKDMTVAANLQSVEDIEFTACERAIFNVLKATLQYPANPETKAEKLAADIEFFCKSAEGAAAIDELLWYTWAVTVEIAQRIPPAHPWQVSLIESLDNLRQRHGSILGRDKVSNVYRNSPKLS